MMGIRQYDLTPWVRRSEPHTHYSCDMYRVEVTDGCKIWYYDYKKWENACSFFLDTHTFNDCYSMRLLGLVFD